jgi:endonuclease/exonuclease/phosphatase family metal-dependent hydrolase
MKIKHLQLNTTTLRAPNEIIEFINNNIDIACLEEVTYPIGGESPILNLLNKDQHYTEGVHFKYIPKNIILANAIITKYPIIDEFRIYYNSDNYQPKVIRTEDEFSGTIIDESLTDNFPGSRGIKNSIKSRCILSTLIQTPSGLLRVLAIHYTVTDLCTETTQMYEMAMMINSIIGNSKDIPTIVSGDFNIREQSYSIKKIEEVLTCHTMDFKDTLSETHRAKLKDLPEGVGIDHVFSKGLKHISTDAIQVSFSEHKALVTEFEY